MLDMLLSLANACTLSDYGERVLSNCHAVYLFIDLQRLANVNELALRRTSALFFVGRGSPSQSQRWRVQILGCLSVHRHMLIYSSVLPLPTCAQVTLSIHLLLLFVFQKQFPPTNIWNWMTPYQKVITSIRVLYQLSRQCHFYPVTDFSYCIQISETKINATKIFFKIAAVWNWHNETAQSKSI